LNAGTIDFTTAPAGGFNGDASALTVLVRGGSANGQSLTFTRYVSSPY